jgi:hypothetical protein
VGGHHGDTLDAFQYLVNLAANKKESDERKYTRITVDIENYREKREQTLRQLARRMAAKVKKTGKSISLEPMSAYERRIIHSEIQLIDGVSTNSVGSESSRRVVLYPDGAEIPTEESVKAPSRERNERRGGERRDRRRGGNRKSRSGERQSEERAGRTHQSTFDLPRHEPRSPSSEGLDSYFENSKNFRARSINKKAGRLRSLWPQTPFFFGGNYEIEFSRRYRRFDAARKAGYGHTRIGDERSLLRQVHQGEKPPPETESRRAGAARATTKTRNARRVHCHRFSARHIRTRGRIR